MDVKLYFISNKLKMYYQSQIKEVIYVKIIIQIKNIIYISPISHGTLSTDGRNTSWETLQ